MGGTGEESPWPTLSLDACMGVRATGPDCGLRFDIFLLPVERVLDLAVGLPLLSLPDLRRLGDAVVSCSLLGCLLLLDPGVEADGLAVGVSRSSSSSQSV